MKSDDALAAERDLEAKFEQIGLGRDRIDVRSEAAPDEGTPAETVDDQPRNELGQFASQEPEVEVEAPEQETESVTSEDPAVAAVLAKYGGDPEKAIAALAHAQRQLGKQSTEVGELRAQNAEYEAMLEELRGLRSDFQQQRQNQPLDPATMDAFTEQAYENPYVAAEYARQQGNNILFQKALSIYKDADPGNYAVYLNELRLQEQQRHFEEQRQKDLQLPTDATLNIALTNVQGRHPEFAAYGDAFADALNRRPHLQKQIEDAANRGSTADLEAAIETVFDLAQGDTLRQLALTPAAPEETSTTSEVVAPTVSEAHGDESVQPTPTEQMRAAMNEEIANRRRGVFVAE